MGRGVKCQKPLKCGPVGHSFREFFSMTEEIPGPVSTCSAGRSRRNLGFSARELGRETGFFRNLKQEERCNELAN